MGFSLRGVIIPANRLITLHRLGHDPIGSGLPILTSWCAGFQQGDGGWKYFGKKSKIKVGTQEQRFS